MIDDIDTIIFIQKNTFGEPEFFEINVSDNYIKYKDSRYVSFNNNYTKLPISAENTFKYIDQLFRIIDSWDNEYLAFNQIDNNDWTLVIYFKNKKKEYSGRGEYPNNFNLLIGLKNNIIENSMVN